MTLNELLAAIDANSPALRDNVYGTPAHQAACAVSRDLQTQLEAAQKGIVKAQRRYAGAYNVLVDGYSVGSLDKRDDRGWTFHPAYRCSEGLTSCFFDTKADAMASFRQADRLAGLRETAAADKARWDR